MHDEFDSFVQNILNFTLARARYGEKREVRDMSLDKLYIFFILPYRKTKKRCERKKELCKTNESGKKYESKIGKTPVLALKTSYKLK